MSSTELFEAASSSKILKAKSSSPESSKSCSLIFLAEILAQDVLPTPRGPVNNKACAKWLFFIAFSNVLEWLVAQ